MRDIVIIDLYNTNKAGVLNTMISVCSQWCNEACRSSS